MPRVVPYIVLGLSLFTILFYLASYQPELVTDILIQLDVFGVTHVAEEEQRRMAAINDLTIPYEEKQVLRNRTVFMGASQEMVKLALGEPKKIVAVGQQTSECPSGSCTYYIYYLSNDKRPTILIFNVEDKLFFAKKSSALDVGN